MATKMISGTLILLFGINGAFAMTCSSENFFGRTTYITCPNLPGAEQNMYCCGSKENRYCCDTPFGLDKDLLDDLATKLPVILGVIGAFIIGLIVLCIVCCCCCPFCLLHKRRNQGTVHQTVANPEAASMMQQAPAAQQGGYPGGQAYPMQQTPGYGQPGYPQQGYPQQGYPQQPYPHHSPYPPTQAYPADQPPAYSEKQAAFNPNYPQQ